MTAQPIDPHEPRPLNPAGGAGAAGKARKVAQEGAPGSQGLGASPAFRVLLERLSETARDLQEKTEGVEKPDQLAGAVHRARQSLDDALNLGGRLLEAWRAERQSPNTTETDRTAP
jgi:hypothetical protein